MSAEVETDLQISSLSLSALNPPTVRTFHARCFILSNTSHVSQSSRKYSSFMVLAADIQGHCGGIICSSSISFLTVIN